MHKFKCRPLYLATFRETLQILSVIITTSQFYTKKSANMITSITITALHSDPLGMRFGYDLGSCIRYNLHCLIAMAYMKTHWNPWASIKFSQEFWLLFWPNRNTWAVRICDKQVILFVKENVTNQIVWTRIKSIHTTTLKVGLFSVHGI